MISLVIIPILCIMVIIYISNLVSFSFVNEINPILTLISILVIILLTLVLPHSLVKLFKRSCLINELNNNANILCEYVSFFILFLFGVSLMINNSLFEFNILKAVAGSAIIILFIYVNYFVFKRKEIIVTVIACDAEGKLYNIMVQDEEGALYEFMRNKPLEPDKDYKAIVLKNIKIIIKVKSV